MIFKTLSVQIFVKLLRKRWGWRITDAEKRMDKFKETLLPLPSENENDNVNSFVNAILFAIRLDQ